MKMLFSTRDSDEIKQVKRKLYEAGIRCRVKQNPVAGGVFGAPACPELWIDRETDILKALRLLGQRRLQEMTVVFPGH